MREVIGAKARTSNEDVMCEKSYSSLFPPLVDRDARRVSKIGMNFQLDTRTYWRFLGTF
jgi:hypothetical protein